MPDLPALPDGTVTFLFTDLEGSTRLLQALPAAYRAAVRRHHALLRNAVEGHGGAVFETVGDAVYAAFERPTAAVAAALAGQLAMRAEDWGEVGSLRARMGLHTGEAERQGGHYFGAPLYRCARLTATAHGGQVVLSQAVYDLVRDALPASVAARDLGVHRLKDLQQPERVFQLLHPDLPGDFPPLRSLDALPHNLPLQLTSFVGREQEVATIKAGLGQHRLVTLTGVGGTGKTRLAFHVAADVLPAYPDGVWLVELAALADPALVPQAVAAAVGIREEPGRPLLTTLAEALRPRRVLLLLDNCEHLLDACARLADTLLRAGPHLRILATSREALGIAGEAPHRVPSLALPDAPQAHRPPPVEVLTRYEAVQLFIERAQVVQPAFQVTNANALVVAEICHRLDGIPLALELAAARVRVLPVDHLLARLEDRFRLLTGGSRTALERHQTLRAAVDWSYDLLADEERVLFDRLSVFAGGWTLEAAEQVCAGDGIESWAVLDLLTHLVDKSLVVVEATASGGGTARYDMLETLRQYTQEKLGASGRGAAVRDQHLAWYRGLATRAAPELHGPHLVGWLDRLEADVDNLRAALRWALAGGAVEQGLELGAVLQWFWVLRDHAGEAGAALAALLARPAAAAPSRARGTALVTLASLARFVRWPGAPAGPGARRALCAEALAICRTRSDQVGAAGALLGLAAHTSDPAAAGALCEQALALYRALGDDWHAAVALYGLGNILLREEPEPDFAGAAQRYGESLTLWRATGDPWGISMGLSRVGYVALAQGDAVAAGPLFEQSLTLFRQLGDGQGIGWMLTCLGDVARAVGDAPLARARYAESLTTWHALGYRWGVMSVLWRFAGLAGACGRAARALRLAGAAAAQLAAAGGAYPAAERAQHERDVDAARQLLGERATAAAWAEGQAMPLEQAVAYALEGEGGDA